MQTMNRAQSTLSAFRTTADRFKEYKELANKSQVGPGAYNDHEAFRKQRKKSCSSKMTMSIYGKETGKPHYVYVGNQLMIDPTFYDYKTKSTLLKSTGNNKSSLPYKDFYV